MQKPGFVPFNNIPPPLPQLQSSIEVVGSLLHKITNICFTLVLSDVFCSMHPVSFVYLIRDM